VQGLFRVPVSELRALSTGTLPAAFGATVSEPVEA
jgi:phosphoribosylformylglycinamidine synthase